MWHTHTQSSIKITLFFFLALTHDFANFSQQFLLRLAICYHTSAISLFFTVLRILWLCLPQKLKKHKAVTLVLVLPSDSKGCPWKRQNCLCRPPPFVRWWWHSRISDTLIVPSSTNSDWVKTLHYRRPTSPRPRTRTCDRTPENFLCVIKFRFPVLKYDWYNKYQHTHTLFTVPSTKKKLIHLTTITTD